jgi:predicted HicB family RNase H-like nuclease
MIGAEGTKTPVGVRFRRDPTGASAEEARRNAHGKRSAWSGNQQANLTEPKTNKHVHFVEEILH